MTAKPGTITLHLQNKRSKFAAYLREKSSHAPCNFLNIFKGRDFVWMKVGDARLQAQYRWRLVESLGEVSRRMYSRSKMSEGQHAKYHRFFKVFIAGANGPPGIQIRSNTNAEKAPNTEGSCHMPTTSSTTSWLCCIKPGTMTTVTTRKRRREAMKNGSISRGVTNSDALSLAAREVESQAKINLKIRLKKFQHELANDATLTDNKFYLPTGGDQTSNYKKQCNQSRPLSSDLPTA